MLTFTRPITRNEQRARRAAAALVLYGSDGDALGAAQDLLTDLLHLTEREGGDVREMLQLAETHFTRRR